MVLATYRSDELDRRHPLTRMIPVWQRTGLAETVQIEAMTSEQVAEMVAAILDAEVVSAELTTLLHDRSEGNPFVLEELLREAVDRREILQTNGGWERQTGAVPLPESVREAVLLRVGRLDPEHVDVLRAGAVLGRSFDYGLLVKVADVDEGVVLTALESAVGQQLLEEDASAGERYSWRHALTQEAIAGDTVLPKRQRIHSRAADALAAGDGRSMDVARHLLQAGRAGEAVGACLQAAADAQRSVAFREAAELLEHVLPQVSDPAERALLLSRIGRLRWFNGEPAAAEQLLAESVEQLDVLGLDVEAAKARVHLGRCRWELDRTEEALADFEQAREALEREGPSAELALAYLRIAGLHAFQLEYGLCRVAAERAVEIAEEASADFERLWAVTYAALGYCGYEREFTIFDQCFHEAVAKGYAMIAGNARHNDLWSRVHTLAGGLERVLADLEAMPFHPWVSVGGTIAQSWALLALGRPQAALEQGQAALARHESFDATKFVWRSRLAVAVALVELGRPPEAAEALPSPSASDDLQDIVYDTPARVRIALALGQFDNARELGRRAARDNRLLLFRETVALAVEALIAGGALDEAVDVLDRARRVPTDLGAAGLALAEGRILLASGRAAEARPLLERASIEFEAAGLALWTWDTRVVEAEAAALAGDEEAARALLESSSRDAHEAGAVRIRDEAQAVAARLGLEVAPVVEEPPEDEAAEPAVLSAGERLVTSLFADVRGYTPLTSATAPEELADRITTFHRWAAAEVGRRRGIVDKFAGDAVMATFNVAGTRVDHAVLAVEAALAIRDKAALMDLPIGIGIAVGPAVVSRSVDNANISVFGVATNLAARLEKAAGGGQILLSDEAFRRVDSWLSERGLAVERDELELKGFDGAQPAFRLPSAAP
jgi:class 3 adenylate cyclase